MLNLHSRIGVTEDRPQLPTKRAPMPNSSFHGGAHVPGLSQSRCPRRNGTDCLSLPALLLTEGRGPPPSRAGPAAPREP